MTRKKKRDNNFTTGFVNTDDGFHFMTKMNDSMFLDFHDGDIHFEFGNFLDDEDPFN